MVTVCPLLAMVSVVPGTLKLNVTWTIVTVLPVPPVPIALPVLPTLLANVESLMSSVAPWLSIPPPEKLALLSSIRLSVIVRSPEFEIPPPLPFEAKPPVTRVWKRSRVPSLRMLPPFWLSTIPSAIVTPATTTSAPAGTWRIRPSVFTSWTLRAPIPNRLTPFWSVSSPCE